MQPLSWLRCAVAATVVLLVGLLAGVARPAQAADDHFFHFPFGSAGTGNGQFNTPAATAVDSSGNVFVVDYNLNRIQKFSPDGIYLAQFGSAGTGDGQFQYPTGIAVDSGGNLFVTDQHNHRIQKFDASGAFVAKWGSFGAGNGQFQYPTGIAVDSSGNVFVTDFYNYRVQKFTNSGTFVTTWGSAGSGNGQFNELHGVAVDAAGNVYVGDRFNYRVQKFTNSGTFLAKWGSSGTGNGQFAGGYLDVAIDGFGDVYVSDSGSGANGHRVQKFHSDGTYVAQFGGFGSGANQFNQPFGVSVTPTGRIYIADTGHVRVSVWQQGETYLPRFRWGSNGTGEGQFNSPYSIAMDSNENVYITDEGNNRVAKFDRAGNFLTEWGSSGAGNGQFTGPNGIAVDSSGNVYVADRGNHRIQKFDGNGTFLAQFGGAGTGDGQFNEPVSVAVDTDGNVFVADTFNHRIQKFDSDGNFLTKWGSNGTGNGQFQWPHGITVDSSGTVYVADTYNRRIQKFDSAGNFLLQWGSYGSGDGQFNNPHGLKTDSSGNVYVADVYNHRIQKFDGSGHLLARWGSLGAGDSQFNTPTGVAISGNGPVYVVDLNNHRISVWSKYDIDFAAPTTLAALAPAPNAAGWNHTDVQVTLGATDNDGGSGVKEIHYQIDGGTEVVVPGATATIDFTAEGAYLLSYYAVDNNNNQEAPQSKTIRMDKTAPTTSANQNAQGTQVTLSANDTGGSGVDKTYYRLDGGTQTEYAGPIALGEGSHSLEYWSVDLAGNEESPHPTLSVTTDTTAPATTATPSPAANANGWNKTDVSVGLSATDNSGGTGVKEIRYTLDGGGEVVVAGSSASVNLTTEGEHTLSFFAVDNAGNPESPQTLTIKIDKSAPGLLFGSPSPAANANGWNKTDVTIGYTPSDTLSGIDTATPGSPLLFTSEGAGQSQNVTVTDKAGNQATFPSPAVRIDKTAPITNASLAGTQVTLNANDSLSGVDKTFYQINSGTPQTYAGPFIAPGGSTVTFWSVDKAGNAEATRSVSVPAGPVRLESVAVTPNPMAKNSVATGRVTLNQNAPPGGILVYLFASKAGVSVPVTITIPAGQSSLTFPVTSGNVSVTLTITANSAAGKKATNLTVL